MSDAHALARQFQAIANAFRAMRDCSVFAHLADDLHAEATKAARLLFKTIDSGLLKDLWKPGQRPQSHYETTYGGLLKTKPNPQAARGRKLLEDARASGVADWHRSPAATEAARILSDPANSEAIAIPDKRLTSTQCGQSWSSAVFRLWGLYSERFSRDAGCFDFMASNELCRVMNDETPVILQDESKALRHWRQRAATYGDACALLADLVNPPADGQGGQDQGTDNRRKRGGSKPRFDAKADAALFKQWEEARDLGQTTLKEFAAGKRLPNGKPMPYSQVKRAIDRVRKHRRK